MSHVLIKKMSVNSLDSYKRNTPYNLRKYVAVTNLNDIRFENPISHINFSHDEQLLC